MEADAELATSLLRGKVEQARRQSPAEKMWDGPRLFAEVCERMKDGIRWRHPEFTEAEVMAELRRELNLLNQLGK
jgi:hypothetical protein